MDSIMTTATFFTALSPTPASPQTATAETSTTSTATTGAATSTADTTDQGFATVYDEQTAQSKSLASDELSTGVEQVTQEIIQQKEGELLPYGLPLSGQELTADAEVLPAFSQLQTQVETPVEDLSQSATGLALVQAQSFDDQGKPLPAMTVPTMESSEGNEDFNEFDHLMQQRAVNPTIQKTQSDQQIQLPSQQAASVTAHNAIPALNERMVKTQQQLTPDSQLSVNAPMNDEGGIDLTGIELLDEPTSAEELNIKTTADINKPQATRPTSLGEALQQQESIQTDIEQSTESLEMDLEPKLDIKTQAPEIKPDGQATNKLTVAAEPTKTAASQTPFKIDVSPKDNRWGEIIAERIAIMNSENIQSARIQLDPPELGLLEIKIRVQQDQVSVAFNSGHQAVREALDSQSGRLKELLEQQGINLADVSVSDQGQQSTAQQGQEKQDGESENGQGVLSASDGDTFDHEHEEHIQVTTSNNLVDELA